MHNPIFAYLFFLIVFSSCQPAPETLPVSYNSEKQKMGPTRIISGDSLPPPREIKLKGMKGIQMGAPKVTQFNLNRKYLKEEKAIKANIKALSIDVKITNSKALKSLDKKRALKPERLPISRPISKIISRKSIKKFDSRAGFKGISKVAIAIDSSGQMWSSGTKYGLEQFDGNYAYYYSVDQGTHTDYFYSIAFDSKGKLWASSSEGLCYFDGKYFTHFEFPPSYKINVDQRGLFWMVAKGKIYILDPLTFSFQELTLDIDESPDFIKYNDDGSVWIFTQDGFIRLEKKIDNTFKAKYFKYPESFPKIKVASMCQSDSFNNWIGTHQGLLLCNQEKDYMNMLLYSKAAEVPTNLASKLTRLAGMAIDENGDLIIAVDGGGFVIMDVKNKPYAYTQYHQD
ncbi:MAG: hypothetical protein AAGK97_05650, partial [Bacteroidota bacterium]